ncbi:MAG: TolC family protein [Campylobacterales bacterium]|nr:TolC family protein [Campylobacterales bacterium]
MTKNLLLNCSFIGVLFLSGCTTIDPHLSIEIEKAPHYKEQNSSTSHSVKEQWWQEFHTDNLNELINKALKQSPDLLSSYEKIEQAKIALNSAGAQYLPSVDLRATTNASSTDSRSSESTNAEVSMNYELDVWGKIAANIDNARESVSISIYDYEAIKLSLTSNIAQGYFNYIHTLQRVQIAKNNLEIAQKVLNVMEARLRFGTINALDVSRQKTTLFTQEATLIALQNQAKIYKTALAILVGESPSLFKLEKNSIETITIPTVSAGLPSELLLRRPDIASAQASIKASRASIMVKDAMRYPSFSLSGATGLSSLQLLSFTDPSYSINGGLGISYNIFDDGILTNARLIEESKAEAILQDYKKVVLTAFKEVEDALSTAQYANENLILIEKIVSETQKTFDLAAIQYKNGLIDFTTFLEIQQSYFNAQERHIVAKQERLVAVVTLYKALGGGFKL